MKFLIWILIGFASFIYWMRKERDIAVFDLLKWSIPAIVGGPFIFIFGWIILGNTHPIYNFLTRTIIKRKSEK